MTEQPIDVDVVPDTDTTDTTAARAPAGGPARTGPSAGGVLSDVMRAVMTRKPDTTAPASARRRAPDHPPAPAAGSVAADPVVALIRHVERLNDRIDAVTDARILELLGERDHLRTLLAELS